MEPTLTQWTAAIVIYGVLSVPLAVAGAWWCKRRYARAVVALQRQNDYAAEPAQSEPAREPATAPLAIEVWPLERTNDGIAPGALAAATRLRRRVLWTQATLGTLLWVLLIFTFIAALAYWSAAARRPNVAVTPSAWGHLILWPLLFAPPLLPCAFQGGWRESHVWMGLGVVFGSVLLGAIGIGTDNAMSTLASVALMAAVAAIPLAFLRPDFRGAGPPLLLALVAVMTALWLFGAVADAFGDGDRNAPETAAYWWRLAIVLPLAILFAAWFGKRILLRLAQRYGSKRFSDLALAHSAYWSLISMLVAALISMGAFEGRTGSAMTWFVLTVFLQWWVWRALQRHILGRLVRKAPPQGPALLLLRVFKPSARSESFMDRLLARWRFTGPAWMIAGPDLAGAFMEPDEFFVWLRRRLRERFVAREDEVRARIDALDNARDPDGRFRVSELFCADATWKPAVLALMDRADVVLLDLREFTPQRTGTHYELVQLLRRADLAKVCVLVDAADPPDALHHALQSAWREAGRAVAPNAKAPRLTVMRLDERSNAQVKALASALALAAARSTLTAD